MPQVLRRPQGEAKEIMKDMNVQLDNLCQVHKSSCKCQRAASSPMRQPHS